MRRLCGYLGGGRFASVLGVWSLFLTVETISMADEASKPTRKPTVEVLTLLDKTERMHSVTFSEDEARAA